MAKENSDIWLKVLIGFIITVLGLTITIGFRGLSKMDENKVDNTVFNQHEKYQNQQFGEIKESLVRIEQNL